MVTIDPKVCDLCGCCVSVCPPDAIALRTGAIGVMENCTECDLCIPACPVEAISKGARGPAPVAKGGPVVRMEADVAVVGAGPGGSMAAEAAASRGATVLVLERLPEIGWPVRCAEGVSRAELEKHMKADPHWVSATIKGARVYAPDGTQADIEGEGYVLDRRLFDKHLARRAVEAGAQVLTRITVVGMERRNGGWRVLAEAPEHTLEVEAPLVVGADGVDSRVGRWAGLRTALKAKDAESAFEYYMTGIEVDAERIDIYLGNQVAPGGYAWIFPKGPTSANVGLGTQVSRNLKSGLSSTHYLNRFVAHHFPRGRIDHRIVGGVPVAAPPKRCIAPGVMLVGDAARHCDPLTGGGITAAMTGGVVAGTVAAESLEAKDFSEEFLERYERGWRAEIEEINTRYYRIKEFLTALDDKAINRFAKQFGGKSYGNEEFLGMVKTLL
jgi:digeranylgeranylglycerophospholipid reductase